ncbi:MAG: hypothetical protein LBM93_03270, partial [Oscillospiraceae bacterium]|nr:hypothetical protein [Oscillospiraceae bacterium]
KIGDEDIDLESVDVNADNKVTIADLVILCKAVVGYPIISAAMVERFTEIGVSEEHFSKFNAAYEKYLETDSLADARIAYAYYNTIIDVYFSE